MKNSQFARRMFIAAASSTTLSYGVCSDVYGIERTSGQTGSAIQQVQYQTGQSAPQSSSAVTQELQKLFQESGQPMPSMNPRDLPNAQGQGGNRVRPITNSAGASRPGSMPATKQQESQPANKNFLQKFVGRISGADRKAAEAAVVPPVPPGFQEPAPAPPASGNFNPRAASAMTGQSRMTPSPAARSVPPQHTAPQSGARPGQVAGTGRPQQAAPQQPVPPVPNTSTVSQTRTVAGPAASGNPATDTRASVQQGNNRPNSAAVQTAQNRRLSQPADETGFVDPFADSDAVKDREDTLDLDSLMPATGQVSTLAGGTATSDASKVQPDSRQTADSTPAASLENQFGPPNTASDGMPLTGVRLNESPDEMFTPGFAEFSGTSSTAKSPEPAFTRGNTSAAELAELPAVELPPVEDLPEMDMEFRPDINLPELDAADAAEAKRSPVQQTPSPAAGEFDFREPDQTFNTPTVRKSGQDAERVQQVAEQDLRLRQQRLIQSRVGQTGFKGFCPVALRDRRDLTDANPQFTATFGLQTYSFSSAQARAAFESDPSRYAPAAGGNDVVLLVNSGEEQPGMLDFALWHRDRLYLFRSRETMAMFNRDPQRFANQY